MALVEEDLPGVSKVRSDFQVREDESMAHRLQEQEFEEHYNSNVQLRRTARVDATVAVSLQKAEVDRFREEEEKRRRELEAKEQYDREHAEELAKKIKEEEEIQKAMKLQDEMMAKKMFEKERQKVALRKRQEEEDARLARQSSIQEEQTIKERRQREQQLSEQEARRLEMEERQKLEKKRREEQLSEHEARRLQHLQKQALERKKKEQALSEAEVRRLRQLELGSGSGAGSPVRQAGSPSRGGPASLPPGSTHKASTPQRGNPSASLPPGALSNRGAVRQQSDTVDYGRQSSPGSSLTSSATSSIPGGEGFQLPSYDDLVEGGQEDEEEPVMDENERIALQEAEDERLARQLAQGGEDSAERERRERKDRELARKLFEEEAKQKQKKQSPHHQADEVLAKRLQQQEVEARKRQKQGQTLDSMTPTLPGEDAASLELAKRLQKEEVLKLRQLKQQKLAQQRVIEAEAQQRRHTTSGSSNRDADPQLRQQPVQSSRPQQPKTVQQGTRPAPTQPQYSSQTARPSATQTQSPVHSQPGLQAQEGHPFNPTPSAVSTYQPAMAGFQVPLASQTGRQGVPQARPSYKRDAGKKKGKK